jgi:hypothetical protein
MQKIKELIHAREKILFERFLFNKLYVNTFCILRHPHNKKLRSPGKDLYWFQYYLLGNLKY